MRRLVSRLVFVEEKHGKLLYERVQYKSIKLAQLTQNETKNNLKYNLADAETFYVKNKNPLKIRTSLNTSHDNRDVF